MAAALGLFLFAVTLLLMYGRCVDGMFTSWQEVQLFGQTLEQTESGDE
jgi:hypothetical protein